LRIGVVGSDGGIEAGELRRRFVDALREIESHYNLQTDMPVVLCVMTTLSSCATRVVAKAVMESPNTRLHVVLAGTRRQAVESCPLENRAELELLMNRAQQVSEHAADTNPSDMATAESWIRLKADCLITIESVQRRLLDPLAIDFPTDPYTQQAMAEQADFNLAAVRCRVLRGDGFQRAVDLEKTRLPSAVPDVVADWILPYFVRADRIAMSYEWRFNMLVVGEFLLAAVAVLLAGYATVFAAGHRRVILIELLALGAVVLFIVLGRWSGIHPRWLAARVLAEKFRSACYLKLAGVEARPDGRYESVKLAAPSEEWLHRAYNYVWTSAPIPAALVDTEELRGVLADGWVRPQLEYHARRGTLNRTRYQLLTSACIVVFALTAVAVVLPSLGVGGSGGRLLTLASIALPALGSALVGIGAHRQYQRHAAIYRRTAQYLAVLLERIEHEPAYSGLQRCALEGDEIMSEESRDWLGAMRFHGLDLVR
jgi:hypothetical protein